jgi:polysaccharide pyruvyl transferase WcaK-like protein
MLNVALIFHSTRSDNFGVGALTVAEVDILRRIATQIGTEVHITVIDWKGPRAPYITGPDISIHDIRSRDLLKPSRFFALIRASDVVIDIGAGDSFADIYGPERLRRMFAMKFLTHLARRPLVVAPQTVGPFTKASSRFLARLTLRASAIVASRDRLSTEAAREIGAKNVIEASDVALRLPYTKPAPKVSGAPIQVGLNVSGLLMNGGYSGKNMFGLKMDYPGMIRELIAAFQAHPDKPVLHLVPHVITGRGDVEDDAVASEKLAAEFPGVQVAPRFTTPSEAKTYIAALDFFAGARMHACIAAFSSGVPVVPMAYSRKFEGLFGTLGYARTVDCTTESADAILAKIMGGYDDRATLQAEGAAALTLGLEKLARYEAALSDLMKRQNDRKRR